MGLVQSLPLGSVQEGVATAHQDRLVPGGFTPLCLWPGWILGTGGVQRSSLCLGYAGLAS